MKIEVFALVLIVVFAALIVELSRRGHLTFKYTFAWLAACAAGMILVIEKDWLFQLSKGIGFVLPSNFIFFTALGVFSLVSLVMTVFLCLQEKRIIILAQRLALLEDDVTRCTPNRKEKR